MGEATRLALAGRPEGVAVEVECSTLDEVEEALAPGPSRLLLDNMDPAGLRRAVELVAGRAEHRGLGRGDAGDACASVAETGVDWISVGAL